MIIKGYNLRRLRDDRIMRKSSKAEFDEYKRQVRQAEEEWGPCCWVDFIVPFNREPVVCWVEVVEVSGIICNDCEGDDASLDWEIYEGKALCYNCVSQRARNFPAPSGYLIEH